MSSYRLGDFFWGNLHWRERLEIVCTHRDSLAADYFRTHASHSVQPRHRISSAGDAIAALAASAVRICSNCSLPPDIEASVALHLRVGDVICGSSLAERHRRPLSPNLYASFIPARTHVYVFAASHFSAASSSNGVRCGHSTREYVKQILHVSKGTLAPPASADCDLCSMVAAKHFIQGQGCFSAVRALSHSMEPFPHVLAFLSACARLPFRMLPTARRLLICADCGVTPDVLSAKHNAAAWDEKWCSGALVQRESRCGRAQSERDDEE